MRVERRHQPEVSERREPAQREVVRSEVRLEQLEEEMQAAIEKAVAEVKAASAADKNAAIEAMKAELMARHEGLVHGMISRSNYEMTLRDAINGTKASDKEKAAMIEKRRKMAKAGKPHKGHKMGKHAKPMAATVEVHLSRGISCPLIG